MNIASWNINSVRIRVDQVKDYLKKKKNRYSGSSRDKD